MMRRTVPIGCAAGALRRWRRRGHRVGAPGDPPGQTPLTAWGFITNPVPSLFLLASLYFYINGLNSWPNPTHPSSNWQKASFFAGILVLFAALQSPVEPLAEHYFSIHQVQHILVRMVGPLLILLGAPVDADAARDANVAAAGRDSPHCADFGRHWIYWKITNPVFTIAAFLVCCSSGRFRGPTTWRCITTTCMS